MRRAQVWHPVLSRHDHYTIPSMRRLLAMTHLQLASVPHFVLGRHSVGEVVFLRPVDLRSADLDASVSIHHGRITVRPQQRGGNLSGRGSGLNQPALLVFRGIHARSGVAGGMSSILTQRLVHASAAAGGLFVDYDDGEGVWTMKCDGF